MKDGGSAAWLLLGALLSLRASAMGKCMRVRDCLPVSNTRMPETLRFRHFAKYRRIERCSTTRCLFVPLPTILRRMAGVDRRKGIICANIAARIIGFTIEGKCMGLVLLLSLPAAHPLFLRFA